MIACKKSRRLFTIFVCIITTALFLPNTQAFGFPTNADFGDVPVGQSYKSTVTITAPSTDNFFLTGLTLVKGDASDFKIITLISERGIYLAANESVGIELTFTPSVPGPTSDTLIISTSDSEVERRVSLTGVGVAAETSSDQPEISDVKDILDFFDASVKSGSLEGKGPGKSAGNRLNALRNMIWSLAKNIDKKENEKLCEQLPVILKKTDSHVQGEAVVQLAEMIQALLEKSEC